MKQRFPKIDEEALLAVDNALTLPPGLRGNRFVTSPIRFAKNQNFSTVPQEDRSFICSAAGSGLDSSSPRNEIDNQHNERNYEQQVN